MPWFKIDDAFHGHPKVMELSPAAVGVWTLSGTWCANYLTDGEIKPGVVSRFGGTPEMIQELVSAGLWIERNGAYHFKDWEDYQPMKADVEAEREAARERMRAARAKKKGVETSPEQPSGVRPNQLGTSEEVRVTPSLPSPAHPVPAPSLSKESVAETSRKKPKTRLPASWTPKDAHTQYARDEGIALDFQAERFRTHSAANDRMLVDWDAGFRNWLMKAERTTKTKPSASSPWNKEFFK